MTKSVTMCRRLLAVDLRGWRTHAERNGWSADLEAYEDLRESELDDPSIYSIR